MTRYFIDCEFIEDGVTIDLISIGVVAEDGREFYAESSQVPWFRANDWVNEHVRPHLIGKGMPREVLAGLFRAFVDAGEGRPEFWSWCSAYDWVAICQLYGPMMDKPAGWPSYCCDLQQELDRYGIEDDELPPNPGDAHNALSDAAWHRAIYAWLWELTRDR